MKRQRFEWLVSGEEHWDVWRKLFWPHQWQLLLHFLSLFSQLMWKIMLKMLKKNNLPRPHLWWRSPTPCHQTGRVLIRRRRCWWGFLWWHPTWVTFLTPTLADALRWCFSTCRCSRPADKAQNHLRGNWEAFCSHLFKTKMLKFGLGINVPNTFTLKSSCSTETSQRDHREVTWWNTQQVHGAVFLKCLYLQALIQQC